MHRIHFRRSRDRRIGDRSIRGGRVCTPYTIARCQGAAARSGVDIDRLVCEGLLGGQFSVAASAMRPSRVNWACVSGAPTA